MTIFNTLNKHFGVRFKNHKGDIGLEIETETRQDYAVPKFSFWDVHNDGSLRDIGREFVLKQPLDFETQFPLALKEFKDKTKGIEFIQDSITTSVHVHLNLLNDNFVTLGNFFTIYSLVENLLIAFSGEDRKSNLFCLPICDAEETHSNMLRMLDGLQRKNFSSLGVDVERGKYGALNLSSLTNYGSLEIRSFRGTTDTEVIKQWVGILYAILKFSRQEGLVPPRIILDFKNKGTEYLSDIFGEYRKYLRFDNEVSLLEKNFWYAASTAYSVKQWDQLGEVPKVKKVKAKDLDKIAQKLYGVNFERLTQAQAERVVNYSSTEEPEAATPYTLTDTLTFRTDPDLTIPEYFTATVPRATTTPRADRDGTIGFDYVVSDDTRFYNGDRHPRTGQVLYRNLFNDMLCWMTEDEYAEHYNEWEIEQEENRNEGIDEDLA